ncbi:helix-turn-helix transcriptional regulator [Agromyces sp. S2-1-8]|uniref:helix-turn-helix transcriptional regulator n=1 Tax=Agromyces sp. S2-1-8 TaxID=2897180 RepID=UPI001E5DAF6E|nr:helix-turn-helix transcriptional regulator [Agromyces sp. S2-1-8]MCD5344941.1 helix-turn-helix transcriptional regulator [Agromyces sp. S2-1-8]
MDRAADDDAVFARSLLDLYADALIEAGGGADPRPRLAARIGVAFDARAVGHVRVRYARDGGRAVEPDRSELCLWRRETSKLASTIEIAFPERFRGARIDDAWYASTARRFMLDWLATPHLAELPVLADAEGFVVVVVATAGRPDEREATRLGELRRHLEVFERTSAALAVASGHGLGAAGSSPGPQPPRPAVDPIDPVDPVETGARRLTARELEVLQMLGDGLLARTIAARMGVSERTVHKHLGNVYEKLGVHDRLLAVRRAESLGLLGAGAVGRAPIAGAEGRRPALPPPAASA